MSERGDRIWAHSCMQNEDSYKKMIIQVGPPQVIRPLPHVERQVLHHDTHKPTTRKPRLHPQRAREIKLVCGTVRAILAMMLCPFTLAPINCLATNQLSGNCRRFQHTGVVSCLRRRHGVIALLSIPCPDLVPLIGLDDCKIVTDIQSFLRR